MGWLSYRLGYGIFGTVDGDNPAAPPQVTAIQGTTPWVIVNSAFLPTSATLTQVPASVIEVLLLAANIDRKQVSIFNSSSSKLYIKYHAGVTTTLFNVIIPPQGFFETSTYIDTTEIWGIWDIAEGMALVTEYA